MAGGKRDGAGRKPGSKSKKTLEAEAHVLRIFAKLREEKGLTPENVSVALLTCGIPAIIQREMQSLREFIYSKPKQITETELTGSFSMNLINRVERPSRP